MLLVTLVSRMAAELFPMSVTAEVPETATGNVIVNELPRLSDTENAPVGETAKFCVTKAP